MAEKFQNILVVRGTLERTNRNQCLNAPKDSKGLHVPGGTTEYKSSQMLIAVSLGGRTKEGKCGG